jgi:hypothetical protein
MTKSDVELGGCAAGSFNTQAIRVARQDLLEAEQIW